MAFAYVLDPTNQFQNRAGVNNVHGFFKVYLANTDDLAVTYKDFNGTLNPERIDIDNNGRAVIIADSSRPYRVEMYEPNGDLVFTQQPVWTVASGGGMTMVDIESTDGSVSVQKTSSGGMTVYDLSTNPEDDPQFLDWIKCSWYDLVDGAYVPRYASGTMSVGAKGVVLSAGMHYHITATIRANKSDATPFYDNIGVHFSLFDGENTVEVQNFTRIVDHSLGLSQDFQVDADIHIGSLDSQLVVSIDGAESGITFNLVSLDAHRIYSGVPKVPDRIARQDWVEQNYQKKLVAGDGITIDPTTNTISAEAQARVQADWDQSNPSAVDYIKNKPSIPAAQVQSDWAQANTQAVDFIKNKPNLATVATSGSYNDLSDKPDIPSQQEQANWTEQDSSKPSYIKNKPNLASVATSGSYDDLSDKPSIPPAQVQSNWNESDSSSKAFIQNKPNLATVATSGDYDDLSNKPSIPAAQVQSDWDQSNSSAVDYIKNKPNIPVVPQMKNLVAGQHITITENGNDIVITAEGGGGQFTTDGNTLRISQATPCDETVIWTVPSGSEDANNYDITLSETIHNFEEIAVYCKCTRTTGLQVMTKNVYPVCDAGNTMFADGISTNHWNVTAGQNAHYTVGVDVRLTGSTGYIGENYRWGVQTGTTTWEVSRASNSGIYPHPYKIVGIKRVANNSGELKNGRNK